MSTKVKAPETANHEPSPRVATAVADQRTAVGVTAPVAPKPWQTRRFQLAAGALIALLVVAVVADNLVARQYTPEGAVRDYLAALAAQNGQAAWSDVTVATPTEPTAVSLTDATAFRSALGVAKPDIQSFDIIGASSSDSEQATVKVALRTSAGTKQTAFVVERSGDRRWLLYPVWRVVLTPALLTFNLPNGAGPVAIDGEKVVLPAGQAVVAVLPISHAVTFGATEMLAEQKISVDALGVGREAIAYTPKLSDAGLVKAKSSVATFFKDVCARQPSAHPSNSTCPQDVAADITYPGQWQLVGDPNQDLAIKLEGQSLNAVGHYQMVFAYTESGIKGTNHVAVGGAYAAALQLTAGDITVTKITRADGLTALDRQSGATDQAAQDLVAKAFARCASVSAEFVADCPQRAPDAVITNVRWRLTGDPTVGATVTYSGNTGILTVHGNFSMAVSYKSFGQARSRSSYVTAYDAHLFWDGQALQLVTIEGV